jgi:hypothetical protein
MVAELFRPDELVITRAGHDIRLTFRSDDGEQQSVVVDRSALSLLICALRRERESYFRRFAGRVEKAFAKHRQAVGAAAGALLRCARYPERRIFSRSNKRSVARNTA